MNKAKSSKWRLVYSGFSDAFDNMATDEAILWACARGLSPPTIRFYGWRPHAVSLGYSQNIEEALHLNACESLGIDIVRRLTGGKAVLHDKELTYSVISPTNNPLFPKSILDTYKKISSCLITGFRRLGIHADMIVSENGKRCLGEETRNDPSCFSAPSLYEITVHGKKICGSAQRRVHGAFLQHGSILLEFDPIKLSEVMVFQGVEKDDLVGYLRGSITSIDEHVHGSMGFSEIVKVFAEGFEDGLEIDLQEGPLNRQEQELKGVHREKRIVGQNQDMRKK